MKKYFQLGILLLVSFCGNTIALAAADPAQQESAVKQMLQAVIYDYSLSGAVVAYGFDHQPLHVVAVGSSQLKPQVAMKNDSLFLAGGQISPFISVLVLQLVENNKIALNDTLEDVGLKYSGKIQKLTKRYPVLAPVTVRELLNHTSGIPEALNTIDFDYAFFKNPKKNWSDDDVFDIAMRSHVYYPPGTKGAWSYSNTDYVLLGIVIEDVTQKSLADNFKKLIDQVKIQNIYYPDNELVPAEALKNLASGYMDSKNILMKMGFSQLPEVTIPGVHPMQAFQLTNDYTIFPEAATGLIASMPALALWFRALFEDSFLSKASQDAMLNVVPSGKFNDASYGLGMKRHVMPTYGQVFSHGGLMPGYSVVVMYFPKYKLVLAVGTNTYYHALITFNLSTGELLPDNIVTRILPLLVNNG